MLVIFINFGHLLIFFFEINFWGYKKGITTRVLNRMESDQANILLCLNWVQTGFKGDLQMTPANSFNANTCYIFLPRICYLLMTSAAYIQLHSRLIYHESKYYEPRSELVPYNKQQGESEKG